MLTRVTLSGDDRLIALGADHARAFGDRLGLATDEVERLGRQVDEAVRYAYDHAYPEAVTGEIEVALEAMPAGIRVAVGDRGRPLPSAGGEWGPLPEDLVGLAQQVTDLRLLNLGSEGMRLTFLSPATMPAATTAAAAAADAPPAGTPTSGRDSTIEVRDAGPRDAEGIAGLLYSAYGLSYLHPRFYQPRWLEPELAAGRVLSTVAVHEGQVIGHEALLSRPTTPAAETGVAAVLPAYRGLGLLGRMADRTLARAADVGLATVFARSVTFHPFSQRSERAHGFRECALCLAALPTTMDMRTHLEGAARGRAALLVLALPLTTRTRGVRLPEQFRDRLAVTYDRLGLPCDDSAPARTSTGSPLAIIRDPEAGTAELTLSSWGLGALDELRQAVRELLREHVDVLYADLDLEAGLDADAAVGALEELGFSYAGLWPDGQGGHDHLRLQRLNCLDAEIDDIVCASVEGTELRDFVLAEYERVSGGG